MSNVDALPIRAGNPHSGAAARRASRTFTLLLSGCLACASMASAQDQAVAADAPRATTPDAALEAVPRDPNIQQLFFASKLQRAKPVLRVDYDASGVPTAVTLKRASGDAALDAAILAWGRQLRLPAGKAGHGFVPFDFGRGVFADQCGCNLAFSGSGGRKLAMILSLR